jgi:hypothetical protein
LLGDTNASIDLELAGLLVHPKVDVVIFVLAARLAEVGAVPSFLRWRTGKASFPLGLSGGAISTIAKAFSLHA